LIVKNTNEDPKVAAYGVVIALMLALLAGPFLFSADARAAKKSPAVISCFHKKTGRFSGVFHPDQCVIKGYRGRGKHFVSVPVQGMKWGGWGESRTRGSFGRHVSTGEGVRVIAYGRRICDDGCYWYSRVIFVFQRTGHIFVLRLPTCDDPLVIG
jgi:hypothetical protein